MRQIGQFILFFVEYIKSRTFNGARVIERVKDIFVAILIVKRGKYSSSFLNSSFLILAVAALVGGPIIAENNPFGSELSSNQALQSSIVSFNPYEGNVGTIVSAKPRDKMVDYSVLGGDTLSTIAKKFDVSLDSLRWSNSLKSDTIKPGQIIKVPPGTGVVHKVVSGDNIYTVAKKYNVDAQNILNFPFNDFADLDTFSLTTGQTLFVPNGSVVPPKPVAAPGGFYTGPIQAGARGDSNFIWPTSGGITQYPIWYHMAVDIANNALPPILASDGGTITFAGCLDYGYGCHIIIDHGNGYQTLYAHLSSLGVTPGQAVGQGQQIGFLGSTGRSSGPHLHFEVRSGGAQLNPLNFLK